MNSELRIELTFSCRQNWDSMQESCNGRFCRECNKEVFDFTGHSIAEIKKIKAENSDICGIFTREQLDPDLVPVEFTFMQKARYFIFVAATMLGLELSQANAQVTEPSKIENTLDTCSEDRECIEVKNVCDTTTTELTDQPVYRKRSRTIFKIFGLVVYRSKRLPGIRVRSQNAMGRFL